MGKYIYIYRKEKAKEEKENLISNATRFCKRAWKG
jgi:hypothetical protein